MKRKYLRWLNGCAASALQEAMEDVTSDGELPSKRSCILFDVEEDHPALEAIPLDGGNIDAALSGLLARVREVEKGTMGVVFLYDAQLTLEGLGDDQDVYIAVASCAEGVRAMCFAYEVDEDAEMGRPLSPVLMIPKTAVEENILAALDQLWQQMPEHRGMLH